METTRTPEMGMERRRSATSVLLSLTTAPVLVGIWGIRALLEASIELGRESEELFRGERLPTLELPVEGGDGEVR